MADVEVVKKRFNAGVWEGLVIQTEATGTPDIIVSHLGLLLDEIKLTPNPDVPTEWYLQIKVPSNLLGDGVQVFLITEAVSGEKLGSFEILAGQPLEDDLRAEIELLRAELDMVKKAFRRHCVETM